MEKRISSHGLVFIEKEEGEVLEVYLDSASLPTAGTGHLLTVAERRQFKVGDKITQAQSYKWFVDDISGVVATVNKRIKVPLTQNQFDSLCSLAFNIGVQSFSASTLVKKLNKEDYLGAADQFLAWNKEHRNGKTATSKGLTARRNRERTLFLKPDAADSYTTITVPSGTILHPQVSTSVAPNTTDAGDADSSSISTSPANIPPTPSTAPTAVPPKTVYLPPSTGGTNAVKHIGWALPSVTAIFITITSSIQSLVDHGYIKADDVGDKLYAFFIVNWVNLVYLAIVVCGYLTVKRVVAYIPCILEFINHADRSTEDVVFVKRGKQ